MSNQVKNHEALAFSPLLSTLKDKTSASFYEFKLYLLKSLLAGPSLTFEELSQKLKEQKEISALLTCSYDDLTKLFVLTGTAYDKTIQSIFNIFTEWDIDASVDMDSASASHPITVTELANNASLVEVLRYEIDSFFSKIISTLFLRVQQLSNTSLADEAGEFLSISDLFDRLLQLRKSLLTYVSSELEILQGKITNKSFTTRPPFYRQASLASSVPSSIEQSEEDEKLELAGSLRKDYKKVLEQSNPTPSQRLIRTILNKLYFYLSDQSLESLRAITIDQLVDSKWYENIEGIGKKSIKIIESAKAEFQGN